MRYGRLTVLLAVASAVAVAACGGRRAGAPGPGTGTFAAPPLVVQVEGSCEDVPLSRYCWKELASPAGCYFLTANGDLKRGPVSWSGKCSSGIAEGPGVLQEPPGDEARYKFTREGLLQGGRMQGRWIEKSPWNRVTEADYANGKRHGEQLQRRWSGQVLREFHYADDRLDGPYVLHAEDGRLVATGSYRAGAVHGEYVRYSSLDGSLLAKGAYANGAREGPWIESYAGFTLQGAYRNSLRNGEWTVTGEQGGIVAKGRFEDDTPQGLWTFRYGDGSVSQGAFLAGRRVGVWTVSHPDGSAATLNYARRRGDTAVDGIPLAVRVEGRCGELPLGFPCWKQLDSPAGCYSWSTGLDPRIYLSHSRLAWTGECPNGIAAGEGTLDEEIPARWTSEDLWRLNEGHQASVRRTSGAPTAVFRPDPPEARYAERTHKRSAKGALVAGRKSGPWKDTRSRGYVSHYDKGIRSRVVEKDWKGVVLYEMNYVDGEPDGAYVSRAADGPLLRAGNYAGGEQEGHWIDSSVAPFGLALEGAYVNGRRQGEWTVTDETGHVISRGTFADDEPHGEWTYWYRNGYTSEGAYGNGERAGAWTVRDPQGNLITVHYEDGRLPPLQPNKTQ